MPQPNPSYPSRGMSGLLKYSNNICHHRHILLLKVENMSSYIISTVNTTAKITVHVRSSVSREYFSCLCIRGCRFNGDNRNSLCLVAWSSSLVDYQLIQCFTQIPTAWLTLYGHYNATNSCNSSRNFRCTMPVTHKLNLDTGTCTR